MPEEARRLAGDPAALGAAVRGHVAREAAYYRGKAAQWDVLNEPLHQTEVLGLLGPGEAREWFRRARTADPSARLYLNEYGLIDAFGDDEELQGAFESFVRRLLEGGAPLDGLGLQCHFRWDLTPPERLLAVLDRLQRLGKPLEATELDVDVGDERLQADYLRDAMIALFSHPAVEGITLWGFWEGAHWAPGAALYRKDWTRRPAAAALEELLLRRWRTDADGRGEFRLRGFLGTYEVRASGEGAAAARTLVLPREGAAATVRLDPRRAN
jgi:GH35 family endo-1,4-beta-xylanase